MKRHNRSVARAKSEVKFARSDRRIVCGGSASHTDRVRDFKRAVRRQGKAICREARQCLRD